MPTLITFNFADYPDHTETIRVKDSVTDVIDKSAL